MRAVGVLTLIVVLELVNLTVHNTFGWAGHVTWYEVGHFNLKTFDKQFRRALPVGTPKSTVEAYLAREGIPFRFDDWRPGFRIEAPYDIRTLKIDIYMDRESKVKDIDLGIMIHK